LFPYVQWTRYKGVSDVLWKLFLFILSLSYVSKYSIGTCSFDSFWNVFYSHTQFLDSWTAYASNGIYFSSYANYNIFVEKCLLMYKCNKTYIRIHVIKGTVCSPVFLMTVCNIIIIYVCVLNYIKLFKCVNRRNIEI
jgi:hypothetical protein